MKSKCIIEQDDFSSTNVIFKLNYSNKKTFTMSKEKMQLNYFTEASSMHHGLLLKEARKTVYEYAVKLNKKNIPLSWQENQ